MCVGFEPSFDFTEYICESCQEAEHDDCDYATEEACACRNSKHSLDNREDRKQKLIDEWLKAYT